MTARDLLAALITAVLLPLTLDAATPSIGGRIIDPSGLPLPGATVTLTSPRGEPHVATSDGTGAFTFNDLPPGHYTIAVVLDGFEPVLERDLEPSASPASLEIALRLAALHQELTVTALTNQDVIGRAQPDAPVAVTRTVMDIAMLPNSQYDDVLALMPNVVRGPDGGISIAGARSSTTGLVVNGTDQRDPSAGGPGLMLPLEAIDTVQVYPAGAPAEFGLSSGGMTTVQTRSGTDALHVRLDSFLPRLLFDDSGLEGVEYWDPDLGLSGPIVRGRVTFQQAVSYRYDRNTYTTLAGPDHNLFTALLSWTQADTNIADGQRLRVSFAADPRDTDHAGVTAFTPSAATPAVERGGWGGGGSYTIASGHVATELRIDRRLTASTVTPDGSQPYVMSHELASGRFFDQQDRRTRQTSGDLHVTWTAGPRHVVSAGASVERAVLNQDVESAPITLLASDGSIARVIAFLPGQPAAVGATGVGLFVQDRWTAAPWLTLDVGLRHDASSAGRATPVQPRAAWTLGSANARTTISGSAGLFADAIPLAALAFTDLPDRQITDFTSAATPTTVVNALTGALSMPRAFRWDLEADERLGPWLLRLRYDERRGSRELVVDPDEEGAAATAPAATATLASDGWTHARSLEATVGFHGASGNEGFVSYVHARTLGTQNDLASIEGIVRAPFVQANRTGPLPSDVPHRIVAWGVFHLPSHVVLAPFLDTRSGFPFTAVNDAWVMIGPPNLCRLPWMTALDLSATRVTRLPHGLPAARVGLKLYNLVTVHSEREVQRDRERADFGTRYDPVPRDFSFVFELLWGRQRG